MRHNKKGRKLGTSSGHTKAMRKSLVGALFTNDRIKTVEARAKEIRPDVDKIINRDYFKGFGIVDCKSTWKPNGLIRMIAGNKAKKYDTTILFDYKGVLQQNWGMPKDSYTVVIVDKNRICRAIYKGKIPESENQNIIQLIIDLTKE